MNDPFDLVAFDFDSTLSAMEGVDELAAGRDDIRLLTARAMSGEIPLEDVYGLRLETLRPTRSDVERIGRLYVQRMVKDADVVIAALMSRKKRIAIVSGGLRPALLPLAHGLGIPAEDVHAVGIQFDADGRYVGFDRGSALRRNGGKVDVMRALRDGARRTAFVGDGVTDLETRAVVDLFVGFGGVVARPAVRRQAAVFVASPTLAPLLAILLTNEEREALEAVERFRPVLDRARSALAAGEVEFS